MRRHMPFILCTLLAILAGFFAYFVSPGPMWSGWENIFKMIGKGDNMPIAGLIPLIIFFTYLALSEAFRHDRLLRQGRADEILDEMYK